FSADAVQRLVRSAGVHQELSSLRDAERLDYRRIAAVKLPVLSAMADVAFADAGRRAQVEAFLAGRPHVRDYARFRAATEHFGSGWPVWPEAARAGTLRDDDVDPAAFRHHAYGQFVAHGQLAALARRLS